MLKYKINLYSIAKYFTVGALVFEIIYIIQCFPTYMQKLTIPYRFSVCTEGIWSLFILITFMVNLLPLRAKAYLFSNRNQTERYLNIVEGITFVMSVVLFIMYDAFNGFLNFVTVKYLFFSLGLIFRSDLLKKMNIKFGRYFSAICFIIPMMLTVPSFFSWPWKKYGLNGVILAKFAFVFICVVYVCRIFLFYKYNYFFYETFSASMEDGSYECQTISFEKSKNKHICYLLVAPQIGRYIKHDTVDKKLKYLDVFDEEFNLTVDMCKDISKPLYLR